MVRSYEVSRQVVVAITARVSSRAPRSHCFAGWVEELLMPGSGGSNTGAESANSTAIQCLRLGDHSGQ